MSQAAATPTPAAAAPLHPDSAADRAERDRLIEALLPHVAFDGWGAKTLQQAAADLGMDPVLAADLLPGGGLGQVLAFSAWADRRMQQALIEHDSPVTKLRDRIHLAVRTRLEILTPHRDAVRRGLALLALPMNAPAGLKALHDTAHLIWSAAGDRSTDHNWYSKRLLLSGVISATTLYWLEDKSEDHAKTWNFLGRQLDGVIRLGGTLGRVASSFLNFPDHMAQRLGRGKKRYR